MDTPDGPIWESGAILRYVARQGGKLYGNNSYEASLVDQWLEWQTASLEPLRGAIVYPIVNSKVDYFPDAVEKAKEDLKKLLAILNTWLTTRTFLVGERISIADISLATGLMYLYTLVMEPAFRKPFGNVTRWFNLIVNQPEAKSVIGEVKLCDKMTYPSQPPKTHSATTTTTTASTTNTNAPKKKDQKDDDEAGGEEKKKKKAN